MGRLAAQRLLLVVVGEDDVELPILTLPGAEEVVLETRDETVFADHQRHPLRRSTVEGHAVAGSHKADDRVIALPSAAIGDRFQAALGIAQFVQNLFDHGRVDRIDLGFEVEVVVVAQLDFGSNLHDRLEDKRLAFLGLGHFHFRGSERRQVRLSHRFAERFVDQLFDGLVEDRGRTEETFENRARCLAGPEPGHVRLSREPAHGRFDGA